MQTADSGKKRLLECYSRLGDQDKATLTAFAEFLASRQAEDEDTPPAPAKPLEPLDIPRPAKESVVAAIRRLTATYPMLDRKDLLNETSSLMAAHVLQGRKAQDVVDQLEAVFRSHYELFLANRES